MGSAFLFTFKLAASPPVSKVTSSTLNTLNIFEVMMSDSTCWFKNYCCLHRRENFIVITSHWQRAMWHFEISTSYESSLSKVSITWPLCSRYIRLTLNTLVMNLNWLCWYCHFHISMCVEVSGNFIIAEKSAIEIKKLSSFIPSCL